MAILNKILGAGLSVALLIGGGAVALNAVSATPAHAQSASDKAAVDAAIARGVIGEQIDGYLGVVDGKSPTSAERRSMDAINIARKSLYTDAAARGNVQTNVFAALTGEKQLLKAAPGTYIKDASGVWKKK